MPAIDFTSLAARSGPTFSLAGNQVVTAAGSGSAYSGFAVLDRAHLEVRASVRAAAAPTGAPQLTVTVEHSDDGLSWSTVHTFTFTGTDTQTADVSNLKDWKRASWTVANRSEWYLEAVTAAPGYVDEASRVRLATTHVSSAQILSLNTVPVEMAPAPGPGKVLVPIVLSVQFNAVATPYTASGVGLVISYADGSLVAPSLGLQSVDALLSSAASRWTLVYIAGGLDWALSDVEDAAVAVSLSAAVTAGDGTCDLTLAYFVRDIV